MQSGREQGGVLSHLPRGAYPITLETVQRKCLQKNNPSQCPDSDNPTGSPTTVLSGSPPG